MSTKLSSNTIDVDSPKSNSTSCPNKKPADITKTEFNVTVEATKRVNK